MEIGEIFSKSVKYPLKKDFLKTFVLFLLFGIPFAIVVLITWSIDTHVLYHVFNIPPVRIWPIFKIIKLLTALCLIMLALILGGYALSVVREGIKQSDEIPSVEIKKNIVDTFKVWILSFVFYIIPVIIVAILMFVVVGVGSSSSAVLSGGFVIVVLISIILEIIFAILFVVGLLRLAKYDSLSEALSFSEIKEDLSKIGVGNLIVVYIGLSIIAGIIIAIGIFILNIPVIGYIGFILLPIVFAPYICLFFSYGLGLLYSDVE